MNPKFWLESAVIICYQPCFQQVFAFLCMAQVQLGKPVAATIRLKFQDECGAEANWKPHAPRGEWSLSSETN